MATSDQMAQILPNSKLTVVELLGHLTRGDDKNEVVFYSKA